MRVRRRCAISSSGEVKVDFPPAFDELAAPPSPPGVLKHDDTMPATISVAVRACLRSAADPSPASVSIRLLLATDAVSASWTRAAARPGASGREAGAAFAVRSVSWARSCRGMGAMKSGPRTMGSISGLKMWAMADRPRRMSSCMCVEGGVEGTGEAAPLLWSRYADRRSEEEVDAILTSGDPPYQPTGSRELFALISPAEDLAGPRPGRGLGAISDAMAT